MSVKHSLLALLRGGPHSASGLQHRFAELTEDTWPLNIGQVSQTLSRLERDGFVEQAGTATAPTGRAVSTYQLTDAGRQEVGDWFSSGVVRSAEDRDELVMKLSLAAAPGSGVELLALLDAQRRATLSQLREVNQMSRTLAPRATADRLQAEHRIFDLEAEIRFLDRVESLQRERTI